MAKSDLYKKTSIWAYDPGELDSTMAGGIIISMHDSRNKMLRDYPFRCKDRAESKQEAG